MKNKVTAWIAIAIVSFLAFAATQSLLVALLTGWLLGVLLTRPTAAARQYARAVTIDAELNLNVILDSALRAFKAAVINLSIFATTFRDVQLKGTNKVTVPYFPLETAASKDFNNCYVFDQDESVDDRTVTIDKRKYQSLILTSEEIARYPQLNAEKLGEMKGEKLAYDIIQDVLSVVTDANFGTAAFVGAANTFDSDDVTDLAVVADVALWPKSGRGMMVAPTYKGNLFKDSDVRLEYAYGDNGVIRDDRLPKVGGFDFGSTPAIPANGENLVGFISYMSAILFAQSPIEPAKEVRQLMTEYQIVTDPDTGISLEYRAWGDPDCDAVKRVIEANYGYAVGEEDALKRMTSA